MIGKLAMGDFCPWKFACAALLAGCGVLVGGASCRCDAQEALADAEAEHQTADAHGAEHAADAHAGGHGHADLGHGNATSKLADAADFRTDLAIYTFVVFMLLMAILSSMAWPKISAALLERERRIETAIADAESKHEAAKRLLVEHEAKLATAADQVREMLEEARRDAEHTRESIVAEARVAADKEKQRAVRDVELAADQAMKNIAETSASLAIQMAGRVLGEQMQDNPKKQAELVRSALAQLAASSPSQN